MQRFGAARQDSEVDTQAAAATVRHRNFLMLVDYAGDYQGFAEWARLSSESVAAWELDADSVTEARAALIEQRLSLPQGWLSADAHLWLPGQANPILTTDQTDPTDLSLMAVEVDQVASETPETLVTLRRDNLQLLITKAGTKLALSPLTGVSAGNLSALYKKGFSDYSARKIEITMGLPEGWLDAPHDAANWEGTVSAELVEKLSTISTERQGPGAPRKPRPSDNDSASRHDGIRFGANWPPLSRALVEKTAALIESQTLTEDVAFALFGQLLQLERGVQPNLPTNLPNLTGGAGAAIPGTSAGGSVVGESKAA